MTHRELRMTQLCTRNACIDYRHTHELETCNYKSAIVDDLSD